MKSRRRRLPTKPMPYPEVQIWKVIDGAVADAFNRHPDYLTSKGRQSARDSIVKRVFGSLMSYAEQSAQSRSGEKPAAE